MKLYHKKEGNTMPETGLNLYQRARKESPYTQEQAAELLNVSQTTVKAWEQGQRAPDNEAVVRMAALYGTPWLRMERALEIFVELGILDGPDLSQPLPSAVLSHWDLTNDLIDGYRRLIQITADGHIDDSEQADFQVIQDVILRNCVAGLKVVFYREDLPDKKRTAPTRARRRGESPTLAALNDRKTIISHRAGNARETFARRGGASL